MAAPSAPVQSACSVLASETTVEIPSSFHRATQRARDKVIAWLEAPGCSERDRKRAARIRACCCNPVIRRCQGGGIYLAPGRCSDRLCATCQRSRAVVIARRVMDAASRWDSMKHLTLTVKNDGSKQIGQLIDHLLASFRRLRQQARWKEHVRCGIATVEVTPGKLGAAGHVHMHAVINAEYFAYEVLKACWRKATGDSDYVHIKPCYSKQNAAAYISSYVAKGSDVASWPEDRLGEFIGGVHGRRMFLTFGARTLTAIEKDVKDEAEIRKGAELVTAAEVRKAAAQGNANALAALRIASWLGWRWAAAFHQPVRELPRGVTRDDALDLLESTLCQLDAEWWTDAKTTPCPSPAPP